MSTVRPIIKESRSDLNQKRLMFFNKYAFNCQKSHLVSKQGKLALTRWKTTRELLPASRWTRRRRRFFELDSGDAVELAAVRLLRAHTVRQPLYERRAKPTRRFTLITSHQGSKGGRRYTHFNPFSPGKYLSYFPILNKEWASSLRQYNISRNLKHAFDSA